MNPGNAVLRGAPGEQLPALSAFELLKSQLDVLANSINELDGCLQRVSRPSAPTAVANQKEAGTGTMLLDTLEALTRIVQDQNAHVNEIRSRLVI